MTNQEAKYIGWILAAVRGLHEARAGESLAETCEAAGYVAGAYDSFRRACGAGSVRVESELAELGEDFEIHVVRVPRLGREVTP